jgi:hypothetical protein
MSDEVIAGFDRTAVALARCRCFPVGTCLAADDFSPVASSFETHRFAMLLRMRFSRSLMVRSAATPRVSNHLGSLDE